MLPEVGHMSAEFLLLYLNLFVVDIEIAFERILALYGFFELFLRYHGKMLVVSLVLIFNVQN